MPMMENHVDVSLDYMKGSGNVGAEIISNIFLMFL